MKNVITIAALVLTGSISQAITLCGVSSETVKDSQVYDHNLYVAKVAEPKMLLLAEDGSNATEFTVSDYKSQEQLQKLNGRKIAFVSGKNGQFAIGFGVIDTSNSSNFTPMTSLTFGRPTPTQPLILMAGRFSIACSAQ